MERTTPIYIAFDGPDGVGKTTFIELLKKTLVDPTGKEIIYVKEPGYTLAGKLIREKVLSEKMSTKEQTEYFLADRILTQKLVVEPALEKGHIVISDRSILTNLIYQGIEDNKVVEIYERNKSVKGLMTPNLTLIPQLPVEICVKRLSDRKKNKLNETNFFDEESLDQQHNKHLLFNTCTKWYPGSVYIDFQQNELDILAAFRRIVSDKFDIVL